MSDLDTFIPPTKIVTVGGRDIEVGVLRMRQLPAFTKAIAEVFPHIVAGEYLAIVVGHFDEAIEAVRVATGLDSKFLGDLRPDEFLKLTTAVFEANLDFFAQAVLPEATKMGVTMSGATIRSGLRPDLSATDTATPTSLN